MTHDEKNHVLNWWGEMDLSMLANDAVNRGIYAGRVMVDAEDTGDRQADTEVPAVAVVLDRHGRAEPWLLYPHPCGWAAVQARLDEGWRPVRSTYGLVSHPSNVGDRIEQVLADLQDAATLPIDRWTRDDGRWGVRTTSRSPIDSREDQGLYREQCEYAVREVLDERSLADAIVTQRRRVRHIGIDPPELAILAEDLVTDLVRAGFHLHDCTAPAATSAYRDGGVCLTPDTARSLILVGWHPHAASAAGRGIAVERIMIGALNTVLSTAKYRTQWHGQALAVAADGW